MLEMITKQTIIIGIGVVVAIALVLFIFVPFFRKTEEGRDLGTLPQTGERPVGVVPASRPLTPASSPLEALKPIPGVIPLTTPLLADPGERGIPSQEIGEIKPPSNLLSIPEAVQKTKEIYEKIQRNLGISPSATGQLTEKQIFDIIWRPEYIAGLRGLENIEIRNGEMAGLVPTSPPPADSVAETAESSLPEINWYIAPAERSAFKTDADVFKSLKNLLAIFHQNGWISDQEYPIYQKALNETLPQIIQEERRNLQSGLPLSRTLPGQQQIIIDGDPAVLSANILSGLAFVFGATEPANAAWIRTLDCYKDDIPLYPIPGYSVPTFFCNAGIKFVWTGDSCVPKFKLDCGTLSLNCWIGACFPPIELGCLNALWACKAWPNAVWDAIWYPLPTTLCGCG